MRKNQQQTQAAKAKISLGMQEMIKERKQQGKSWGLPKGYKWPSSLDNKGDLICDLIAKGYSYARIGRILNTKPDQLGYFIRSRGLKPRESPMALVDLVALSGLPTLPVKRRKR